MKRPTESGRERTESEGLGMEVRGGWGQEEKNGRWRCL